DVPQVRVRVLRTDLGAHHEELAIRPGDDVLGGERFGEARPAGAGVELVERAEQWLAGDDVDVDAGLMIVPVLVPERRLGAIVLGDLELHGSELLLQLGLCRFLVVHPTSSRGEREQRQSDTDGGVNLVHGSLLRIRTARGQKKFPHSWMPRGRFGYSRSTRGTGQPGRG